MKIALSQPTNAIDLPRLLRFSGARQGEEATHNTANERSPILAYPVREPTAGIVRAASALGIRIEAIPVNGPEGLEAFFAAVRTAAVDAIVITNIAWMGPHEQPIAAGAMKSRVPAIGTWKSFAKAGGLLSYGPTLAQHWPRLAAQVDKILKGVAAGDVPVEFPTEFELVINMKTAKALGITFPQSLRQRANEVIQ